jgi:pSer/pThr/pTyr-binding forkhead associated (FHA) protein
MLKLFDLGSATTLIESDKDEVTVGRSDKNDVSLPYPGLSRHHAHITRDEDGHWWVTDLESRNGTYLRDEKLGRLRVVHHPLNNGDIIWFANLIVQATF